MRNTNDNRVVNEFGVSLYPTGTLVKATFRQFGITHIPEAIVICSYYQIFLDNPLSLLWYYQLYVPKTDKVIPDVPAWHSIDPL